MNRAGIVLCGGRSDRMGTPKFSLRMGDETMLQRVVRILGGQVDEVIVVAAQGQELPLLSDAVRIVRDRRPERGPLEGLLAGLVALGQEVTAAYATGCDTPFLAPQFVARMFDLVGEHEVAAPQVDGKLYPLAAVYRPSVIEQIERLLANDRLALFGLLDAVATRVVTAEELFDVDPLLESLINLNRPEDYAAALARAKTFEGTP